MSWLPQGTSLGDLSFDETYIEMDGPRVFTCRSATGQTYLAGWAEEGEDGDIWLYLPISAPRLRMVRSGGLTLRDAFEDPEGFVYEVFLPHDEDADADQVVTRIGALPEEWLPEEDFRLQLSTETLPTAADGDEWRRLAAAERRARARLMVKWPRAMRSEAPTRQIGEILVSTQLLFDNIGLAMLRSDPPQAGRIPIDVAEQTATDVVALSAASFVVDIASSNFDDLFDGSVFLDIIERVLALLDPAAERETLLERLAELRPRGAKSFRNFIEELASTGADITFAAASTTLEYTSRGWSSERLTDLSRLLNTLVPEDVYEIRGRMRLYRADTDRKQFGVIDEMTENRFEGSVSERALAQMDHAVVNEFYEVLVSEFRSFDEAVGERKPIYVLEQLAGVTDTTPIPTERKRIEDSGIFLDENPQPPPA